MPAPRGPGRRFFPRGGGRRHGAGESVDWLSLHEQVRRYGVLDAESLQLVAVETATSLVSLHASGRIHGDLGPERIILGSDGPRVVGVEPLHPAPEATAVPEERSPDPRRVMGQERDVFGWAESMVFAARGAMPGGVGPAAGSLERGDVPDSLGDLLRDCLGEAWQRPTAREMLYRLSGALPTGAGAPPTGAGAPPTGAGAPPTEAGAPPTEAVDEDVSPGPHQEPDPSTDVIPLAGDAGTADPPGDDPGLGRRGHRRVLRLITLILILAVLVAGGVLAWNLWGSALQRSAAPAPVGTVPAATTPAGTAPAAPSRGATPARVLSPGVTSAKATPTQASPPKVTPSQATPTGVMTSAATPTPPARLAARLTGRWVGTLSQSHTTQDLAADVVLQGDRGGRITLPEIGCTGVLTVLEDHPDRVVYRDVLTQDMMGECAPSGTVTITRADPGALRLAWVNDQAPHNTATGLLRQG